MVAVLGGWALGGWGQAYKQWAVTTSLALSGGASDWKVTIELVLGSARPKLVQQAEMQYTLAADDDGGCVAYRPESDQVNEVKRMLNSFIRALGSGLRAKG